MKHRFPRFVSLLLLLALILAMVPVSVQAQQVISVSPTEITNDVNNNITVTGEGFDATATVYLGDRPLVTSRSGIPNTLIAIVPAGIAAGSYEVTVQMENATVQGFANLTVTAPAPQPVLRPQISVQNYRTKPEDVRYGQNFTLIVKLRNQGESQAFNVQATFTSTDFVPLKNGGVNIIGDIMAGNSAEIEQPMTVANWVSGIVTVAMSLSYTDATGTAYTETFNLNIRVSGGGGVAAATATPTGVKSSQLVITSYATSVEPLQPGVQFTLTMTVENTGNIGAQRVTMIVGGGSSSGSTNGTPQPGGVSGGSGEFTNFAPVGASNVQTLGDLPERGAAQVRQDLIVNVSTTPGAYPMKVTFSYLNEKGETINDEQVITLLVYSLPTVDISFYRPPDPFFVGQPGALPIQVVNLGKRLAVLGTIKIETASGMVENGTSLVGSLDAGGYYTLDAMVIPDQPGPLTLDVTIDYTDDFNQQRTINRTLEVDVMEMEQPIIEPGMEGGEAGGEGFPIPEPETPLQRAWRFILGLFGLDSAPPSTDPGIVPGPAIEEPLPAPQPGAGKG